MLDFLHSKSKVLICIVKPIETQFKLFMVTNTPTPRFHLMSSKEYNSKNFNSFEELLESYMKKNLSDQEDKPKFLCASLTGPICGDFCNVSLLGWRVHSKEIERKFKFEKVLLVNDFEAVSHGILQATKLDKNESFYEINRQDSVNNESPFVIFGISTGLGKSLVLRTKDGPRVVSGEGGHIDFVPRNNTEFELKEFIEKQFNLSRVEVENVISGMGLDTIFCFLADKFPNLVDRSALKAIKSERTPGKVIVDLASANLDHLCLRAVTLFVSLMAVELGNMALKFLPFGGIYVVGDLVPNLLEEMNKNSFMESFISRDKSLFLTKVPIYVQRKQNNFELEGLKAKISELIAKDKAKNEFFCRDIITYGGALVLTAAIVAGAVFFNKRKKDE